jgi:hypothetical protein
MENKFTQPTDYEMESLNLDGEDIMGLFVSLDIFESIYMGGVTGSLTIMDTDGTGFIEKNEIEFIEEIDFSFKNANGDKLEFEGFMNGLRDEKVFQQKRYYTIDFNSKAVRKNETNFITKKFDNEQPEGIAQEMAEKLESEVDSKGQGEPLTFLGSRKKPLDIMKYVMSHSVTQNSTVNAKEEEGESKGTTGFLFWETLDGYRFTPIDELLKNGYEDVGEFKLQLAKIGGSMEQKMKGIINYEFPQIGDFQSKLRSGAFESVNVSFDMDKGEYVEVKYKPDNEVLSPKAEQYLDGPSRFVSRFFVNEIFSKDCKKTPDNEGDQSRRYLQQNIVRQNTFSDQHGRFVIPPHFSIRAGDKMEVKIPKIGSGGQPSTYNEKHSGSYIIKQVSHHITNDRKAYTKLSTIRSTKQQNDSSSQ